MAKQVLIAGCGDIGGRLAQDLVAAGFEVTGLRRSEGHAAPHIETVRADITDPATLEVLQGRVFDYLVFCPSAGGFNEAQYRAVYYQGLHNLLQVLGPQPVVLFVSSTSVYHQNGGEWVDEDAATEPQGFSGRVMLEAEQLALTRASAACVIRFGGIYGPGRSRFIERTRSGVLPPAEPLMFSNRIHSEDCAAILCHLLRRHRDGDALAPIYLGVDGAPAPLRDIALWLARQLGLDSASMHDGEVASRGGNKRCSNQRLLDSGYRLRYPNYKAGFTALLKAP